MLSACLRPARRPSRARCRLRRRGQPAPTPPARARHPPARCDRPSPGEAHPRAPAGRSLGRIDQPPAPPALGSPMIQAAATSAPVPAAYQPAVLRLRFLHALRGTHDPWRANRCSAFFRREHARCLETGVAPDHPANRRPDALDLWARDLNPEGSTPNASLAKSARFHRCHRGSARRLRPGRRHLHGDGNQRAGRRAAVNRLGRHQARRRRVAPRDAADTGPPRGAIRGCRPS